MATEEDLSAAQAELLRNFQDLGGATLAQQAALDAAATGIKGFDKGLKLAGKAAMDLGKSLYDYGAAVRNSRDGLVDLGNVYDKTSAAAQLGAAGLSKLAGASIPAAFAVGKLTGAIFTYLAAADKNSKELYKAFQGLGRVGGVASDGITGLSQDMIKLGYGIVDLDTYVRQISENSGDLALMSGNVRDGAKQFANVSKAMEGYREGLMAAGMTQEEINEGQLTYLRLQTRLGRTQNQTTEQLAQGVHQYLIEQDALTKLTGMNRKEQEDARQRIREEEQFLGTLIGLRRQGDAGERAAEQLEQFIMMVGKQAPTAAKGLISLTTGSQVTAEAQQQMRLTAGDAAKVLELIKTKGLSAQEAFDLYTKSVSRGVDVVGEATMKNKVFTDTYGPAAEAVRLSAAANNQYAKQMDKIAKDQIDSGITGGKAADAATANLTETALANQRAKTNIDDFVNKGLKPATAASNILARAFTNLTNVLPGGAGPLSSATPQQKPSAPAGAAARSAAPAAPPAPAGGATQQTAPGGAGAGVTPKSSAPPDKGAKEVPPKPAVEVVGAGPGFTTILTPDGDKQSRIGVRNWRNNNPGNIEYGQYAKSKGAIGSDGRFAVFPDLATGTKAKEDLLFGSKYADLSIAQAISKYAPPNENDTNAYIGRVVAATQASQDTLMRDLSAGQRQQLLSAVSVVEGFKPGKVVQAAEGGVFDGPKTGYPATLHGNEAVIPLKNGAVPVNMPGIDAITEDLSEVTGKLATFDGNKAMSDRMIPDQQKTVKSAQEIVRSNKDTAEKMMAAMSLLNPAVDKVSRLSNAVTDDRGVMDKVLDVAAMLNPQIRILRMLSDRVQSTVDVVNALGKMKDGGVTQGPSIAGEAGPEAVIPLKNGAVPVELPREFSNLMKQHQALSNMSSERMVYAEIKNLKQELIDKKYTQEITKDTKTEEKGAATAALTDLQTTTDRSMTQMVSLLTDTKALNEQLLGRIDELVRAQRDNVSVNERMLRQAQNS